MNNKQIIAIVKFIEDLEWHWFKNNNKDMDVIMFIPLYQIKEFLEVFGFNEIFKDSEQSPIACNLRVDYLCIEMSDVFYRLELDLNDFFISKK